MNLLQHEGTECDKKLHFKTEPLQYFIHYLYLNRCEINKTLRFQFPFNVLLFMTTTTSTQKTIFLYLTQNSVALKSLKLMKVFLLQLVCSSGIKLMFKSLICIFTQIKVNTRYQNCIYNHAVLLIKDKLYKKNQHFSHNIKKPNTKKIYKHHWKQNNYKLVYN